MYSLYLSSKNSIFFWFLFSLPPLLKSNQFLDLVMLTDEDTKSHEAKDHHPRLTGNYSRTGCQKQNDGIEGFARQNHRSSTRCFLTRCVCVNLQRNLGPNGTGKRHHYISLHQLFRLLHFTFTVLFIFSRMCFVFWKIGKIM